MMWAAGDAVVLRELHGGRLWSVRPATVVRDAPDLIALYLAPGAPWLRAWGPDGRKKRLPVGEWRLVDIGWPWSCLRLHTPGTHHDVLVFWSADHAQLRGWYVNLQTPLRQTPLGFDYTDEFLDVIVEPDRSAWRWEDEDDLADALRLGLVTAERARFLRAEGERAVELLRARRPPYDRTGSTGDRTPPGRSRGCPTAGTRSEARRRNDRSNRPLRPRARWQTGFVERDRHKIRSPLCRRSRDGQRRAGSRGRRFGQ